MVRETTATFIGHRECYGLRLEDVRGEVVKLIEHGVTDFLCGGMGQFDYLCARAVYRVKEIYPHVKCHVVIPYLTYKVAAKELFDSIIYPEGFEKYHYKAAIPARNKWMVDNSEYAICYVTHDWGGAAKTYERAVKLGRVIVNMSENPYTPKRQASPTARYKRQHALIPLSPQNRLTAVGDGASTSRYKR